MDPWGTPQSSLNRGEKQPSTHLRPVSEIASKPYKSAFCQAKNLQLLYKDVVINYKGAEVKMLQKLFEIKVIRNPMG